MTGIAQGFRFGTGQIPPPQAEQAAIEQEPVLDDPLPDRTAQPRGERARAQVGDPERGTAGRVAAVEDGEEQLPGVLGPADLVHLVDDEDLHGAETPDHVLLGFAGVLGPGGADLRDQRLGGDDPPHPAVIRPGVHQRVDQPGFAGPGHPVQDGVPGLPGNAIQQGAPRHPMTQGGRGHGPDFGVQIPLRGGFPGDVGRLSRPAGRAVLAGQEPEPPVRVALRDPVWTVLRAGAVLMVRIGPIRAVARHEVREDLRAHRVISSGGKIPASMASLGHQCAQHSSAPA